ncbi:MAG: acyl-CoA thioesterase [Cryomorphaceae bacterium]|nr:acyl-CoA thioesterase [Flavobacteriales bacterium]
MISHITSFRVRYAETDRMGYLYYGNYATYFEVGRVELLRSLGISYRELEDKGILLPVRDFSVRYIKPAYYDELLSLETTVEELSNVRIAFDYKLKNDAGELLTTAKTTLVFVDKVSGKPVSPPSEIAAALADH